MPKLQFPDTQAILAIMLAGGFVGLIFYMALTNKVDTDVFKVLAGAFSAVGFTSVVGFYFGSSQGSKGKDDTLNVIATKAALNGDAPKPDGVPHA